jgi:hypothetical protein
VSPGRRPERAGTGKGTCRAWGHSAHACAQAAASNKIWPFAMRTHAHAMHACHPWPCGCVQTRAAHGLANSHTPQPSGQPLLSSSTGASSLGSWPQGGFLLLWRPCPHLVLLQVPRVIPQRVLHVDLWAGRQRGQLLACARACNGSVGVAGVRMGVVPCETPRCTAGRGARVRTCRRGHAAGVGA